MPKAIYTEAHTRTWIDVAVTLQRDIGLAPCYWVGKHHFEPRVRECFPDVVFHTRTDAIRGVPPPELANMRQRPLDAEFLKTVAAVQLTCGKMMDRLDVADGFRMEERVRLFHVQVRYWRAVLERFQPDIVCFPVQPHTLYDYILYELCKLRGIRTCMFQWTILHDWIFPLTDIDRGYEPIRRHYARLLASDVQDVQLDANTEQYVARVSGDYVGAVPDYLVEQMPAQLRAALFGEGTGDFGLFAQQVAAASPPPVRNAPPFPPLRLFVRNPARARKYVAKYLKHQMRQRRRDLQRGRTTARRKAKRLARWVEHSVRGVRHAIYRWPSQGLKRGRGFYRRHLRIAVRAFLQGDMNRPLKEPGVRMEESFRGRWGGLRLQWLRLQGRAKKQRMLRDYHRRCVTPDFTVPYIFVALHYQPEQTTCPTGSVFVDQQLMVDMLARLAPPGWKVYVKEHPFQFFPNSIGERSRTSELYDDLQAIPNVSLVPWSVTPFELIDHAKAVATVTGTAGLEALMRGTPVLTFGYAWYRDCEGAFYTPTNETCREALQQIERGFRMDRRKVRLYLKAVEDCCFRADMDFGVHIDPPVPHEETVAHLASSIRRVVQERDATRPAYSA